MLAIIRRANGNGRDLREMAGELFEAFDAATAKTTHLGPDPEQEIAPTQPAPSAHDHGKPQTWLVVIQYAERAGLPEGFIADMRARHELGMKRYGTPLQPFNGRNSKLDLYEEMLDATAYAANCAIENFVGGALGAIAVDSTFHQVLFMAAGMRP
jgi:hypothetical protein